MVFDLKLIIFDPVYIPFKFVWKRPNVFIKRKVHANQIPEIGIC